MSIRHQVAATAHLICFDGKINRDRNRFGSSGNIAGEHQRGAKFAQCPREGKNCPCEYAGPRERQCHFAKHAPFRSAQRTRRLQQAGIHLFERRASRQIHQRKSDHRCGNHGGRPGKHDCRAKFRETIFRAVRFVRKARAEENRPRWEATQEAEEKRRQRAPSPGLCGLRARQQPRAPGRA